MWNDSWTLSPLVGWLVTFVLHSTLWIASAVLVARFVPGPLWRERLWKGSVAGALASTALVFALGSTRLAWRLPEAEPSGVSRRAAAGWLPEPAITVEASAAEERLDGPTGAPTPEAPLLGALDARDAALGSWLLVAGVLLVRWARAHRAFARDLQARRAVLEQPWIDALQRLCAVAGVRRGVRLTVLDRLSSPVALLRDEIVVPRRALAALSSEERDALLAHELAHLVRRDPHWRVGLAILARILWVQPLLRLAANRAAAAAELCSDDLAARWTRGELALARCLARVAGWLDPNASSVPAAGMVAPRSVLLERVERLLERQQTPRGQGLAVGLWFTVSLSALACAGPSLGGSPTTEPAHPALALAAEAREEGTLAVMTSDRQEARAQTVMAQTLQALRSLGYVDEIEKSVPLQDERITQAIELADSCPEAGVAFHVGRAPAGERPTSLRTVSEHRIEVRADGSVHCGEMQLVLPELPDDRLLRFHLAEIARVQPDAVLELLLRSASPNAALQQVLEACAASVAGLWRFTLVTEAADGSRASMPFALPRDSRAADLAAKADPIRITLRCLAKTHERDGTPVLQYEVEYTPLGAPPKETLTTGRLEALRAFLVEACQREHDRRVIIDPRPGTLWQDLTPVVDAAVAAGFTDITFVGLRR